MNIAESRPTTGWTRSSAAIAAAGLALWAADAPSARAEGPSRKALASFGRVPLHFERNDGQWDPEVLFLARGPGYALFLAAEGPVLKLLPSSKGSKGPSGEPSVVRMRLGGSSRASGIEPASPVGGVSHYYPGADRSRWRTEQRQFERVTYTGVYPGIDVVYYGNQRQLEYDFLVQPGADPSRIRMRFEGTRGLEIDPQGNLVLRTPAGTLVHKAPAAYQETDGRRTEVPVRFDRRGREARFRLGDYDTKRPLVIDPLLVYSTYLGGNDIPPAGGFGSEEAATGVAVDGSGSAYLVGYTGSTDFPLADAPYQDAHGGGYWDVFVTRFSLDGQKLIFSTYLGGGGDDLAWGIALDPAGNAYICGYTASSDFPTLGPYQASLGGGIFDAFAAKLSADGALQYSTYLGGGGNDAGYAIAVNAGGEATLVGSTGSTDFPTTAGAYQTDQGGHDTFVTRLAADGSSLLASTYLGGSGTYEAAYGVALDDAGNVFVVGETDSTDFPTLHAYQGTHNVGTDAFVTQINSTLSDLDFSTYLGGNSFDFATGVAFDGPGPAYDGLGHVYVVGGTNSTNFPTVNALQTDQPQLDGFITKFRAYGGGPVFSTYLGGAGFDEFVRAVAVDGAGDVYVTGETNSGDFPTLDPIQGPHAGIDRDAFVTKLAQNGIPMLFSTYLASTDDEDSGAGLALDASGNVYVAGKTWGTTFPTVAPFQATMQGAASDAFLSKISGLTFDSYLATSAGRRPAGRAGASSTPPGTSSARPRPTPTSE